MKKVLLVEDDKLVALINTDTLEEMGYIVKVSSTGAEALEQFYNNKFDFILMDIGLPDIDGLTVTRKIREKEASSSHTPIIALTARAEEGAKAESLQAGADAFLLKPMSKESLEKVLVTLSLSKES